MPLYGFTETIDGREATLVVAGETLDDFTKWYESMESLTPQDNHFSEIFFPGLFDVLQNNVYKGFKHTIPVFFHDSVAQRDCFIEAQAIQLVQSLPARDRHEDMLLAKQEEIRLENETDEDRNRTIEERLGLDVHDPWDNRDEAEREEDLQMKKALAEGREKGEISNESFAGPDEIRAERARTRMKEQLSGKMSETMARDQLVSIGVDQDDVDQLDTIEDVVAELTKQGVSGVEVITDDEYQGIIDKIQGPKDAVARVTDIKTTQNADGSISVDSITAIKRGGEVDEDLRQQNIADQQAELEEKLAGRDVFSPDDFADALSRKAPEPMIKHAEPVSRGSLRDAVEAQEAETAPVDESPLTQQELAERSFKPYKPDANQSDETPVQTSTEEVSISLRGKLLERVQQEVESGFYGSPDEVVREALRRMFA